jgi:putative transposase
LPLDRDARRRRSIRLAGYDYARGGAYFVTICTYQRKCHFGEVVDGEMRLNDLGRIVEEEWLRTPTVRPNVLLDAYVIMPNHLHGIIVIDESAVISIHASVAAEQEATTRSNSAAKSTLTHALDPATPVRGLHSPRRTLGSIVRGFKAVTTRRSVEGGGALAGPLWQRNFYEHIIRNDADMARIRHYIQINPSRWEDDRDHPRLLGLAGPGKGNDVYL